MAPESRTSGTVYIVLDDFSLLGRAYRETAEASADARTVVRDMIAGQYHAPVRVIAFNIEQGWARDVSTEIARSVALVAEQQGRSLSRTTWEFLERHLAPARLSSIERC